MVHEIYVYITAFKARLPRLSLQAYIKLQNKRMSTFIDFQYFSQL